MKFKKIICWPPLLGGVGAGVTIAILAYITFQSILSGTNYGLWLAASFGSSVVVVFGYPDNEFSSAKFETFLSNAEAPAISIFLLNKDICEKDFPNLIITPSKPPSLIKVFEPAPKTLILSNFFKFLKKIDNSFKFFGLNITFAGPPKLNQEYLERLSSNKIWPEIFFSISFILK